MSEGFIWLAYLATYGALIGYALYMTNRLRRLERAGALRRLGR